MHGYFNIALFRGHIQGIPCPESSTIADGLCVMGYTKTVVSDFRARPLMDFSTTGFKRVGPVLPTPHRPNQDTTLRVVPARAQK